MRDSPERTNSYVRGAAVFEVSADSGPGQAAQAQKGVDQIPHASRAAGQCQLLPKKHTRAQKPAGAPSLRGSLTPVRVPSSRLTLIAWVTPLQSVRDTLCPRRCSACGAGWGPGGQASEPISDAVHTATAASDPLPFPMHAAKWKSQSTGSLSQAAPLARRTTFCLCSW